jgi:AbrB family looped-hinge helix DNA binding protein
MGFVMTATITSKGQITIPKMIRDSLGVTYGDCIDFKEIHGEIVIRPVEAQLDVEKLRGMFPVKKHASDAEIKKAKSIALAGGLLYSPIHCSYTNDSTLRNTAWIISNVNMLINNQFVSVLPISDSCMVKISSYPDQSVFGKSGLFSIK